VGTNIERAALEVRGIINAVLKGHFNDKTWHEKSIFDEKLAVKWFFVVC
jgi:hypothetical protein